MIENWTPSNNWVNRGSGVFRLGKTKLYASVFAKQDGFVVRGYSGAAFTHVFEDRAESLDEAKYKGEIWLAGQQGKLVVNVSDRDKRLIRFAEAALSILEANNEWDSNTTDAIASVADSLNLFKGDDQGFFVKT
jgi:hypothetical protein